MGLKEEDSSVPSNGNYEATGAKSIKTEDVGKVTDTDRSTGDSNSKRSASQGVNFSGDSEEITVILALRTESFNNKMMFSAFIEKLKNHVLTSFKGDCDMMPILEKMEDPRADIVKEQPKDLDPTERFCM